MIDVEPIAIGSGRYNHSVGNICWPRHRLGRFIIWILGKEEGGELGAYDYK